MTHEARSIDKDLFKEIVENVLKISAAEELVEIARILGMDIDAPPLPGNETVDTVVPSTEEERMRATRDQYADRLLDEMPAQHSENSGMESEYVDMARFVPLRLEYNERRYLRLLESTIDSSDYTDRVDGVGLPISGQHQHRLIALILKNICSLLSGLVIAHDSSSTTVRSVLDQRDFATHQAFFRKIFEIGRRYKILNPERMRESYFKMMYFMQDLNRSEIAGLFDSCFDIVAPVETVYTLLTHSGDDGLAVLRDPWIETATSEILPRGKTKYKIQEEIRAKEAAIKRLVTKYSTSGPLRRPRFNRSRFYQDDDDQSDSKESLNALSRDNVERCLYSLCDYNTFLRFNQGPCERMIELLQKHFTSHTPCDPETSLAIVEGQDGARLSHSHSRQYTFVIQSLTFWSEVMKHMLRLWHAAEADLLDPANPYIRTQTGQGLQRVQKAPRVLSLMTEILKKVQHRLGGWVGSSTIHLGDENVPNALIFIDKYMQVPKILQPIVLCIDKVEEVTQDTSGLGGIVKAVGGVDIVERQILGDFFRHGFDGSGADNFFDAGSCVDGRLTSAWNWCSKIEQKPFYPVFQLTGFVGFDSSGNR